MGRDVTVARKGNGSSGSSRSRWQDKHSKEAWTQGMRQVVRGRPSRLVATSRRSHLVATLPCPLYPLSAPSLQEFRRLQSAVGAARDRLDLLGGAGGSGQHAPLLQQGSNAGLLLRERGMLASTNAALDEVMGTAQVGHAGRCCFEHVGVPCCRHGQRCAPGSWIWLVVRSRSPTAHPLPLPLCPCSP